jgi:RNA polymerase sigma-70 factor, ECF subfamily
VKPTLRDPEPGPEALARRLYEDHGPALSRWVRGRFTDPRVAEEVVQESVLTAWRKFDQYDPTRGSERAWMFGITRNVASSRFQRDRRHLRVVPTDTVIDLDVDDAELAGVAERSVIADALRSLSDDHIAVVAAAYWDGLSTKEIATRLGIPDGTVKSRLHYALRALRAQLQEREVLQ